MVFRKVIPGPIWFAVIIHLRKNYLETLEILSTEVDKDHYPCKLLNPRAVVA